jgi:hypothetical protein
MSSILESAFRKYENMDPELSELRRKAHETHQDVAGLTPKQISTLEKFDNFLRGKSIISDFDLEQQEILLLPQPKAEQE